MDENFYEQKRQGRRLAIAGQVVLEASRDKRLYFRVDVLDGPYYLCYDFEVFDFVAPCTCLSDSFWNQNKHYCRHCHAVKEFLKIMYDKREVLVL